MKNTLYIIAMLLLVSWIVGLYVYSADNLIHVLLVLSGVSAVLAYSELYKEV